MTDASVGEAGTGSRWRMRAAAGAVAAVGVAVVGAPDEALDAAAQSWPPFVLVAGLLLVGVAAAGGGLFDAVAAAVARRDGARPATLLAGLLLVVAGVTAVLNLDTAVVFLTPILVLAARGRGLDERPFLYGALFMANAASLLLPGSNLTNLLVLETDPVGALEFARRMAPAFAASVTVTIAVLLVVQRRSGDGGGTAVPVAATAIDPGAVVGVVAAALLVLALDRPALPVLAVGAVAGARAVARGVAARRDLREAVDPVSLGSLFCVATALGAVARVWDGPAELMADASGPVTAAIGALAAVVLNNLPATVLLASRPVAHPEALLLGVDLGPNLAVTGSLASLLWWKAARSVGGQPSVGEVSRLGIVLVPLTLLAAGLALAAGGR